MFTPPNTHYVVCHFEGNKIIAVHKCESEAEAFLTAALLSPTEKYAVVAWMELGDSSKLVWILKDNISKTKEDDMDLMMVIYEKLFSFDDEWAEENT